MAQSSGSPLPYDPDWQTGMDGPLAPPMRDRINALLASSSKISLASIAREVGLSPSFMAGLMRAKAIRTRHMPRFNTVIEGMEQRAGIRPTDATSVASTTLVHLLAEVAATLPRAARIDLRNRIAAMP